MRQNPIITEIDGKQHEVVYIEYDKGKPHAVITLEEGKYRRNWDFELNLNWDRYMHHESGCGGGCDNIDGPQYIDGCESTALWFAACVTFSKVKPKNCKILENPIRLKTDNGSTINPFKFSTKVAGVEYCKFCEGYYDESGCSQHMDLWNNIYNDGTSLDN